MDETLLPLLITTEDQDEFISIIDHLLSLVYTNETSITSFLHSDIPDSISKFFVNHFQSNLDQQSKEQWLKKLREELALFEKLSLTIAFHPSRSALEKMIAIARRQYGPRLVLEIKYNPEIIAGAEIVYKGMYRDITSRGKLEEVLASMKGKLK